LGLASPTQAGNWARHGRHHVNENESNKDESNRPTQTLLAPADRRANMTPHIATVLAPAVNPPTTSSSIEAP
jgi:hypothetical protein